MTPLDTFLDISQKLASKPADFWPTAEKKELLTNTVAAIGALKKSVEAKKLVDTHAYKQLLLLEKTVSQSKLDEVKFIQQLTNLVDIYRHAPASREIAGLIEALDKAATRAKQKILEHYLSLEHLATKAKKMTKEQKLKGDNETIQKIGIFYVLEYTLQVLFEFTRLSDADKVKLLKEGINVKEGNLPAYYLLEDSFRRELCYNLFDDKLRHTVLDVFYQLENVLYSEDNKKLGKALQILNIKILRLFQANGLNIFKGLVYYPFGNNVAINEIINKVENIKF